VYLYDFPFLNYQDNNNPGYDGDDSNRLPAHIESRVAREKPCRTLFVRNVQVNHSWLAIAKK